ncbi:transcriptional regulator with XRE-family HTH domain [Herbihabitans rhizosphaerae]|uniref:Transcriptional regulator with XRE-family HTH domain n=1 Tax=Herbihabitans rhizosphaerae TaxID=1872711 RepID=A0A4Q7L2G7_9PSEU|nr:helix-turn-helix transcriptional regulator [Herbihabitans rhizosphaerae]RZS43407.1 transcriptional regulator with XRE-family HTH domain [Herbihabitans rhizosphaerae]
MSSGQGVPFRRRRLGKKLREMREAAGKTLEEAGAYLDMSRSALQRWESGETRPNINVVRSMMDLYDCRPEGLLDEVRAVREKAWYEDFGIEGLGGSYIDAETESDAVHELTLQFVPGLLQTEGYMRALFAAGFPPMTQGEIDKQTKVRLIRQERLLSVQRPLELIAIVAELALHLPVGGPDVMGAQLRRIVEMTKLPTVTVQVIPRARGAHGGMRADFTLLHFPYPDYPEMLYSPFVNGAKRDEKYERLQDVRLLFDQLRSEALDPAGSAELIERLAGDLYGS